MRKNKLKQMFEKNKPIIKSNALTPVVKNKGPITNSVPAACSPAYIPKKLFHPFNFESGMGILSNSPSVWESELVLVIIKLNDQVDHSLFHSKVDP